MFLWRMWLLQVNGRMSWFFLLMALTSDIQPNLRSILDSFLPHATTQDSAAQAQSLLPNAATPLISRLSTELLLQVFAHALAGNDSGYHTGLHTLSNVCASWTALVSGTPSLWAFIHTRWQTSKSIQKALALSQCHFLVIKYSENECHSEGCDHEGGRCRTLMALMNQSCRWKVVTISVRSTIPLDCLQHCTAPILERFDLSVQLPRPLRHSEQETSLDLFKGQGKRMRDLRLSGVGVRWRSLLLSGLRSLSLCHLSNPPSLQQLLDILRSSPGLASLHLESLGRELEMEQSTTEVPIEGDLLPMASLRHFAMINVSAVMTTALFSLLSFPRCCSFTIDGLSHINSNATLRHISHRLTEITSDDSALNNAEAIIQVSAFDATVSIQSGVTR